jgi:hypothetical protein
MPAMIREIPDARGLSAALVLLLSVGGVVACGGSSKSASPDASHDGPVDTGSVQEAGLPDVISGIDAPPKVGVEPVGTALVRLTGAQIRGVTDDGYVAYLDANGAAYVVSLSGGSPRLVLAPAGGTDAGNQTFTDVAVSHTFVAAWSNTASSLASSPLNVWSAKLGTTKQIAQSSSPGAFQAAPDSSFFTYLADPSTDGSAASLYGALADGTHAAALLPSIVVSDLAVNCAPKQVFAGSYVVVASCAAGSFGGAAVPTVASFNSQTGWTASVLVASAIDQLAVDPAGANVLTATSAGALEYVPVAGGVPVAIDMGNPVNTTPTSSSTLFIAPNPTRAIYQASSGALKTAPLPAGEASALPTGSVGVVFGLSPDGSYVSYATPVQDLTGGYPLNLNMISTTPGGTVLPLEEGNPGSVFYDLYDPDSFNGTEFTIGLAYPFTADSAYALFTSVPIGTDDDTPPGSLQAAPVTGKAVITAAATQVYAAVPLAGSKVLWNDGYNASGNAEDGPVADLRTVDLSLGTPSLIIQGADADFGVSPDNTKVIYSLNYGVSTDGVYVTPIP